MSLICLDIMSTSHESSQRGLLGRRSCSPASGVRVGPAASKLARVGVMCTNESRLTLLHLQSGRLSRMRCVCPCSRGAAAAADLLTRRPADPSILAQQLITPFLDLDIKYYDLGMENRDATDDKVTVEAAEAILKYGVGIKVGRSAKRVSGVA